jgi:hypothetical protein
MFKIGIFGDSFGYEQSIFKKSELETENIGKSWVTMLRDYGNVCNFCEPGSDLYFSYKNFIDNFYKFDKIIFLKTNYNRFSFKFEDSIVHAHSINNANMHLLNNSGQKYKAIKASIDYFLYLQDEEKDKILYNLYLNDITNKNNDVIFINCFGPNSLNEIMQKENQAWNLPSQYTFKERFIDLRKSHLTKNNNEILFRKVLACINRNTKKINIDAKDFCVPHIEEKKIYIIDD